MIPQVFNGMIAIMLARFFLNDLPHAAGVLDNPGNPGNPSNPGTFSEETETIMARTGLGEYKPPPFGVFAERDETMVRRRKPPASVRAVDIWVYRIVMERRNGRCRIKLYEYISGRGDKLRATWSGEGPYCDVKFRQISDTVRQVEFEYKSAMKTALGEQEE